MHLSSIWLPPGSELGRCIVEYNNCIKSQCVQSCACTEQCVDLDKYKGLGQYTLRVTQCEISIGSVVIEQVGLLA